MYLYNHYRFALYEIEDALSNLDESLRCPRYAEFHDEIQSIFNSLIELNNRLYDVNQKYHEKQEKSYQKQ